MLIPDNETEVDFLNCEAISQTIIETLKHNRSRPLTIGIHGDWGAGKSSILKMIEKDLSSDKNVAVLWFNGWTFEGFDDAKTVLIEATITELCRQRSTVGKVKEFANKLIKRVNWLKVAKRGSGVAFNIITGLPSPDQIGTALSTLKDLAQNAASINPSEIPARVEEVAGFLKPSEDGENLPDTIHEFRKDFQELLQEAKVDQLVVLIDDLDRCLPTTAIETLEAIRLFLFVPKTAFIIAADEAMIEYAVRQHFPDLPVASGPLPYARNYLEKLVQIPFTIPMLGAQETRTYVTLLLVQSLVGEDHDGFNRLLMKAKEGLKKPWLGASLSQTDVQEVDNAKKEGLDLAFVLAQQIAPMLAEGTKGNPRQVKRFLNALIVRQMIAKARGFEGLINQPVLAKLMLAERFQPDFYERVAAQAMTSDSGKARDVVYLEGYGKGAQSDEKKKSRDKKVMTSEKEIQQAGADKWLERDWLKRWLQIKPELGNEDLRPYVFVVRDKRMLSGESGSGALEALIKRLCGSQLEVRTAESEVKALIEGDANTIFSVLRERVLSVSSLNNPPPGINGLTIVAKHHHQFQSEVVKLLGSLDPKKVGLWILKGWNEAITESKARDELKSVIRGWETQEDNSLLKQGAPAALKALDQGAY